MKKADRKGYPTDVSDEEWSFAAPYLTLMDVEAPQRKYELRDMFDALRWMARAGAPWRMLPNDFPPWELVYQQTQRWLQAGCFESMVSDLRSLIRLALAVGDSPVRSFSMGARYSRPARAARVRAMTVISANAAARYTLRWT
ncbi:transposase [Paraburkholderia sp. BL18I3N2]|nr:transposase [Paraburkholderia sp. BL18I3N2]PRX92645.1 transposase [Paraburkholderia sp. BL25I1N1]TDY16637.1 transposase [Paraburkholderia sp. BL6665CI2N2]